MKELWEGPVSIRNPKGSWAIIKGRLWFRFKMVLLVVAAIYGSAYMGWIQL